MTRPRGVRVTPRAPVASRARDAPAPRKSTAYECDRGHGFTVTYAAAAVPPDTASCRCGGTGRLAGHAAADPGEHARRMVQLRQRRTEADLEELLAGKLAELAAARGAA